MNPGHGPERSASAGCSPPSTELEARLGHVFKDGDLLKRALTHSSADTVRSNERLEFLGDRVLGLVAAEKLHELYPDDAEGALADMPNLAGADDGFATSGAITSFGTKWVQAFQHFASTCQALGTKMGSAATVVTGGESRASVCRS